MNWEALIAVSVAVIAVTLMVLAVTTLASLRDLGRLLDRLEAFAAVLERDGAPLVESARSVVGAVKAEVDQIVATSRELRSKVSGAAGSLDERVRDLEAVLDVLQEEVEETALDVAAALRATRRGTSLLGAMKRALFRGRR
jgi:uncharacterized protein YoxC